MRAASSLLAATFLSLLAFQSQCVGGEEPRSDRFRSPERPDDPREAFDLWALAAPDGRVRISPMRQWSRTGLQLRKGQRLGVRSEGNVKGCQRPVGSWAYGPFGPAGGPSDLDPDARVCALIGRIVGDGQPRELIVGERLELEVPFDGRLDLGVSDVWHFDNSGEFLAQVTIDGHPVDFVKLQGPSPVAVPERLTPVTSAPTVLPTPQPASMPPGGDAQTSAGRDHLMGWYKLQDGGSRFDTVIPVFVAGGTYYSVGGRGIEVPLKPCAEGLEWAIEQDSMTGTKIMFDKTSGSYSIVIVDEKAQHFSDSVDPPKPRPMIRIDKPAGLPEATAQRPRTNEDFAGWYQWAWFPAFRFEVRKSGEMFLVTTQSCRKDFWETDGKSSELTPLPGGLGFGTTVEGLKLRLVYNENRQRYEIVWETNKKSPYTACSPVARIPAPPSPEGGPLPPMLRIGIPPWH